MHRTIRRVGTLLTALAGCLIVAVPAASAASAQSGVRVGSAPVLPSGAQVIGSLPASNQLQLTVMLEPQSPAALESYATTVSTPGSPSFRQYLSVEQFARRFGAAPAQIATVSSALREQGLNVGAVAANDLTLPVSGTAAQVEQALSVSLSQVKTASGRVTYANQQAPLVPAGAAPYVQGVVGLSDLTPEEPQQASSPAPFSDHFALNNTAFSNLQVATGGPQPCLEAQELQTSGYTADQIASAYQFSSLYGAGDLGAGQTIAVFEQEPFSPTDISAYQACYGTATSVTPVEVGAGPGPYKGRPEEGGEADLDIEQIIGLAPKASILVYQGALTVAAPVEIISAMVSQNKARVISSSWGECEQLTEASVISAENTLLQEAAAQGQSFFVSSGDSGSEQCSQGEAYPPKKTELAVLNPASQPFATGVGGTSMAPAGPPPTEYMWNEGPKAEGGGGTGGGLSTKWTMPSYQSGAASSLGVINSDSSPTPCNGGATDCREVPDVSANADSETGYIVHTGGQWTVIGGTSAAAPLWAALAGLTNASAACRGVPIGFANPALYQLGGSAYSSDFHDVTKVNPFNHFATNDTLFAGTKPYPVTANYDMTTGIGTPVAPNLAAGLCSIASPVYTVSIKNPGKLTSAAKRSVRLQIKGTDSGNAALTYSASGLPAGLKISSGGLVSGTPKKPGISKVTVSAGDQFANSGSVKFKWTITKPGPISVSGAKLGGVSKRKPKLSFTVSARKHTPAISAVSVSLPKGFTVAKSPKRGVAVSGTAVKLSGGHSSLGIDLLRAQQKAKFKLGAPALGVSGALANEAKHGKLNVQIRVAVTNSSHHTTKFVLTPKVS